MKQENISYTIAKSSMIYELKKLWKLVFGDSESYINLFFEHRFVPAQTMVALYDGVPIGMLFLLPITLKAESCDYNARYIYAVGTHPAYRSQGVSGRLLEATHARLQAEGVALSLLVPAEPSLFDYYGARGFETEFYCSDAHYNADLQAKPAELRIASLPDLLRLRDRSFSQSQLYARWDREALDYQQKETALMGGETLHFLFPQEGYAVCYPTEEVIFIKEWGAPALYPEILDAIAARYNCRNIHLRLAADFDARYSPKPFAMTRWYLTERTAQPGKAPYLALVLD